MGVTFPIISSRQRILIGSATVFSILPTVAVALRIVSQRLAHRPLTASDYCAAVATVFAIGYHAASIAGVFHGGTGYAHESEIVAEYGEGPITTLLRILFSFEILWSFSVSLSKTSILLLYIKLFRDSYVAVASKITTVVVLLWPIASTLGAVFICTPISQNWQQIQGSHCGNQVAYYFVSGVINLLTDFIVFGLPLPHLYRLRLPNESKIGLIIVFALGFLTSVISIVRLPFLLRLVWSDLTWTLPTANVLTGIEPSMAVTLSCVPLLKPLLSISKRRKPVSRVMVAGNELRTHQYDPEHARKLKLRADKVMHTARISATAPAEGIVPPKETDTDDSVWELKGGDGSGPEITVNKKWEVTSEKAGDWTQMLGTRS